MRLMFSVGLFVLLASTLPAKTIYVNNLTGNNRNRGALAESHGGGDGPLKTISAALKLADGGDHIQLANTGQPYRESITLQGARHSGGPFTPFVLDGSGATLEASLGQRVGVTLYDVRNVVIHNLQIEGFRQDGINAHDNVFDGLLVNVTCTRNGRAGLSTGGRFSPSRC